MREPRFEGDARKAQRNLRKHVVTFDEAKTVWEDGRARFFDDWAHSDSEDRAKAIGFSNKGRLLAVIFTVRNDVIRIISARKASSEEAASYAEAQR